jgi:hypothetical protein
MKMGITVHFYDGFDMAKSVHMDAIRQALAESAFEAEALVKQNSRVDTGAQRASTFVVTPTNSTYSQSAAEAEKLQPGVKIFPEPNRPSENEVILAVGVEYGYWNEVLNEPFVAPAIDEVAPALGAKCRNIIAEEHNAFLSSTDLGATVTGKRGATKLVSTGNKRSAQARKFGTNPIPQSK